MPALADRHRSLVKWHTDLFSSGPKEPATRSQVGHRCDARLVCSSPIVIFILLSLRWSPVTIFSYSESRVRHRCVGACKGSEPGAEDCGSELDSCAIMKML